MDYIYLELGWVARGVNANNINMKTTMILQPHIRTSINSSRKTTLVFTLFGIFGVLLAGFFILNLTEIPGKKMSGANLISNSSFENWSNKLPVGWLNTGAVVKKDPTEALVNKFSVKISESSSKPKGIMQTILLDPNEIYNICYSIKTLGFAESAGVEIIYETDTEVKTTTDAEEGVHYLESDEAWKQYFGRVTGAKSVTLFFFAKNNATLFVDAVGVGTNIMPLNVNKGLKENR